MSRRLLLVCGSVFLLILEVADYAIAADKPKERGGGRKPSAISDDVYDAILTLVKGNSLPSCRKRTSVQKAVVVRFWRAKGGFSIQKEKGKE